jgi:hypothetical protein
VTPFEIFFDPVFVFTVTWVGNQARAYQGLIQLGIIVGPAGSSPGWSSPTPGASVATCRRGISSWRLPSSLLDFTTFVSSVDGSSPAASVRQG